MALAIRAAQFKSLEESTWRAWISVHTKILTDLLPEVAATCPGPLFSRRVETLLRRADLHGMSGQLETLPYCYASLTLGVGFEAQPNFPWAAPAMALRGPQRGEALWDGLETVDLSGFETP